MEPVMFGTGTGISIDSAGGTTWDAIVVGAGPAGSLAARLVALGGARVLLVEHKRFPRSKTCGACLNARAMAILRACGLGSLVARRSGIALDEIQLGYRGRTARLSLVGSAVLSRESLDAALVDAATDAGVHFLPETHASLAGLQGGIRLVNLVQQGRDEQAAARVVLIAAGFGRYCTTHDARAKTFVGRGARIGVGCQVADAPDYYGRHSVFMAVGRAGYVGMVRLEDGRLNVAAALEPEFVRRLRTPGAAARAILAEARFVPVAALETARWQGTAALLRQTRPLAEERLFLLGDAAGYVAPFTGEGIAWALASAHVVAPLALQAIERWDKRLVREWSSLHWRLIGRRHLVCRAVALALRQPALTRLGFEFCKWAPSAAELLATAIGGGWIPRHRSEPATLGA
jgi:flavin-dependent dehydrogenase